VRVLFTQSDIVVQYIDNNIIAKKEHLTTLRPFQDYLPLVGDPEKVAENSPRMKNPSGLCP